MKAAKSDVRASYRKYIAWTLAKLSGSAPVKRTTNQEITPTTCEKMRSP
jgi:hypothetical protein